MRLLIALLLLFVLPLLASVAQVRQSRLEHWSQARWDSAGLAPAPAEQPDALVQVYAARTWGWKGALLAVSVVVFWLLLQFTRALRAMRAAGGAPVGQVASAVMLQTRLKPGMRLMDIILLTHSLGQKQEPPGAGADETFRWADTSGAAVTVDMARGRCLRWELTRPPELDGAAAAGGADAAATPGTGA